jgi:hypothetical protein
MNSLAGLTELSRHTLPQVTPKARMKSAAAKEGKLG